ncbi:MAG: hypothetical protein AAGH99_10885 [Planctomycetota bacterium]
MKPCTSFSEPPWATLLRWLERGRWWVFAGIGIVYAVGLNGRWRITSDSAFYVLKAYGWGHGEAGSTAGELAWVPVGATPPGLPVLIAAGGGPGWGSGVLMLGFAAAALVLVYRLFLEHADRRTAVLMVLLTGVSGMFYEWSFGLLTELPFAGGLLLLLWGHERRLKRRGALWLALGMMAVGVLWMAAFRSVALVVVAAYVLAEGIRLVGRRDQRGLGTAIVGLALAGGFGLWLSSSAVRDDVAFFFGALGDRGLEGYWFNFRGLMVESLPEAVFGQDVPPSLAWPASVLVVVLGLYLVRARLLWAVLIGVLLLQWVVFVHDPRYALPVLPLLFFGLWRGGLGVLGRWREPWRLLGFVVLGLAVCGANVVGVVNTVREQRSPAFYEAYRSGKYAAAVELSEIIRAATPVDAELIVAVPPEMALELSALSGRGVVVAGEAGPSAYLVGEFSDAVESGLMEAGRGVGPVLGRAVDRRSGEVWTLRQLDP